MGFERSQIQGKYSKTKTNSETSPQNTVFFRSSKKKIENKMNISMSKWSCKHYMPRNKPEDFQTSKNYKHSPEVVK